MDKLLVASIGALSKDMGAGVPDLTGFEFPTEFTFKSHAPFNLSLAEISGFLRPNEVKVIRVIDSDNFERMIHSVGQIAFLNGADRLLDIYHGEALSVSQEKAEAVAVKEELAAEKKPDEAVKKEDKPEPVKEKPKADAKANKNRKKGDK